MYVIILSGIILISISCALLVRPEFVLEKFRLMIAGYTWFTNLVEAVLRLAFGVAFFTYGDQSNFPLTLKIFGGILIAQGVIIFVIPLDWHRRFALWALDRTSKYLRLATLVTIPFGAFLIYAVL